MDLIEFYASGLMTAWLCNVLMRYVGLRCVPAKYRTLVARTIHAQIFYDIYYLCYMATRRK